MDYPEHEKFSHPGLTASLLSALEMAMLGDEKDPKYGWYNGLLASLEPVGAEQAGWSAVNGGSTVAAHADHILVTFRFVQAMFGGHEFQPDWGASWHQRSRPGKADWDQLKVDLRREYEATRELIEARPYWRESGFTQMLHHIAHIAYHASAVRQILKAAG
ncbi:MAG: hypothetical protein SFU83_16655 [Meiothermus sp.]|nr:hypothetical protein [Meiothermus sp.]